MTKNRQGAAALALLLALTGCATTNYGPNPNYSLIDPRGVNPYRYEQDFKECNALAEQTNTLASTIGGALLGIAAGAVIGGAYGNQRGGMAAGSSMGGFYGSQSADNEKHMVLRRCLANRGYAVIR